MGRATSWRLAVLCCLLGGPVAVCVAQTYTPPLPRLTTLPPCPVPKDAKEAKKIAKRTDCDPSNHPAPKAPTTPVSDSPAEKFPYPGDYPGEAPAKPAEPSAAKAFPYPGENADGTSGGGSGDDPGRANPNVAHDPAAEKKAADTAAGKAFPYPGDPAPVAAKSAPDASTPAASSSSSNTSDDDDASVGKSTAAKAPAASDDEDDDQPRLADKGSEGKRNKRSIKTQTDSERVDEDLSVAKFYGQSGNSMGAYLRAKDAVKTEPDLPEARFVMGEAAKRLNKLEEAKAEFSEYLKLAPDGEHAKAAEKALSELR